MGIAGGGIVIQAFYGDDAKLAGDDELEGWVVAKCWYIRARTAGVPAILRDRIPAAI